MTEKDDNKNNSNIIGGLLLAGAAAGSAYYLFKKDKELKRTQSYTRDIDLKKLQSLDFCPSFLKRPSQSHEVQGESFESLTAKTEEVVQDFLAKLGRSPQELSASHAAVSSLVHNNIGRLASQFYCRSVSTPSVDIQRNVWWTALAINALEPGQLAFLEETFGKFQEAQAAAEKPAFVDEKVYKQVQNDVPRTFRTPENSGDRKTLRDLLLAVSWANQSYCQGMNFIAANLMAENQPSASLVSFFSLMFAYRFSEVFAETLDGLHYAHFCVEKLMRKKTPTLFAEMERQHILSKTWSTQWFLTLFSYTFRQNVLQQIWDGVMLEGFLFLLKVGTAIMVVMERLRVWERADLNKALSEFPLDFELEETKFMELVYSLKLNYDEVKKLVANAPKPDENVFGFVANEIKSLFS